MAVRDAFGSKNLRGQILTGDEFKYAPEKRLNAFNPYTSGLKRLTGISSEEKKNFRQTQQKEQLTECITNNLKQSKTIWNKYHCLTSHRITRISPAVMTISMNSNTVTIKCKEMVLAVTSRQETTKLATATNWTGVGERT